jgi:hypothetical protein
VNYRIEIEGLLEMRISDIHGTKFGLFPKELSGVSSLPVLHQQLHKVGHSFVFSAG